MQSAESFQNIADVQMSLEASKIEGSHTAE